MGHPFVHPAGVTIYDPEKSLERLYYHACSQNRLRNNRHDGNVVRVFKELHGFPINYFQVVM